MRVVTLSSYGICSNFIPTRSLSEAGVTVFGFSGENQQFKRQQAGVTPSIHAATLPSIGRASIGAAASVISQWQCARYSAGDAIGI